MFEEPHPQPGALRGQPVAPGLRDSQGSKRERRPRGVPWAGQALLLKNTEPQRTGLSDYHGSESY